jgi:hypothetical protein
MDGVAEAFSPPDFPLNDNTYGSTTQQYGVHVFLAINRLLSLFILELVCNNCDEFLRSTVT